MSVAAGLADIGSLFLAVARRRGDQPALIGRGGVVSFAELAAEVSALARGFLRMGLGSGERAAVLVPPSRQFVAATFALMRAGAVPVLIDPGIGWRNLGRCLEEAEPALFLGSPKAQFYRALGGWARSARLRLSTGHPALGAGALDDLRALGRWQGADLPALSASSRAAILFTSGSTGAPKGAVYEHGMFAAQLELLRGLFGVQEGELSLATFPLFALFDIALGQTVVLPEMDFARPGSVDPMAIIAAVQRHGARQLFGSPALLDRVGRFGERHGVCLPTLARVVSAGAPVPTRVLARFAKLLAPGVPIYTPYGATEALPVALTDSREILGETAAMTERGAGVCVGRPVCGIEAAVIRVCDGPIQVWSEGLRLPPGAVGEIAVKGPVVTGEYFRRAQDMALAKIGDGARSWHRMGDLGYVDERGRLWFCGRKSHRVRTASGELYSVQVEGVFNACRAVRRTALVGVGSRPVLCVEREPEADVPDAALREELLAIGAGHDLTRDVKEVLFHPGLPVDIRHNAKIDRLALADWAARRL